MPDKTWLLRQSQAMTGLLGSCLACTRPCRPHPGICPPGKPAAPWSHRHSSSPLDTCKSCRGPLISASHSYSTHSALLRCLYSRQSSRQPDAASLHKAHTPLNLHASQQCRARSECMMWLLPQSWSTSRQGTGSMTWQPWPCQGSGPLRTFCRLSMRCSDHCMCRQGTEHRPSPPRAC